jgi:hypothetical protein
MYFSSTPTSNRKRQLPNIPAAQLHANREKGLIGKWIFLVLINLFVIL